MRAKRFVLDTNVWISYLITKNEHNLLRTKVTHKLSLFICDELLDEIHRVLEYPQVKKYKINSRDALNFVKKISVHVELQTPIKEYLSADPNDNYIIALALQTNSGYITSGDRHILSEKKNLETRFKKLRIISKAAFEKMFA